MPDNNFEDEVRKKMEELRFVPSGQVWTKVEENIREDRKRRRILFWLPLAGCLIGGMLWFTWSATTGSGQAKSQADTKAAATAAGRPEAQTTNRDLRARPVQDSALKPSAAFSRRSPDEDANALKRTDPGEPAALSPTGINTRKKGEKAKPLTITNKRRNTSSGIIISETDYLATVARGSEKVRKETKAPDATSTRVRDKSNPGKTEKENAEQKGISREKVKNSSESPLTGPIAVHQGDDPAAVAQKNKTVKSGNADPDVTAITNTDSTQALAGNKRKNEAESTAKTKSPVTDKAPAKKRTIEWGITASGGITKQVEKNAILPDVLARAFLNSYVYIIQKSGLNPGPAFSAGLVAAKQIGRTWRLQTGIQYTYFSSRLPKSADVITPSNSYTAVAAPNGGLGGGAAAGRSHNEYSNRYQFIQIPVAVEKQFGLRSPVSVQAGFSLGYLSAAQAFIYEPLLDQFSQDNEKFNRFQVSGLAGVYWRFKIDPHWSLRAGPEVQYQLGNFLKSSASVNDHLLTGAVRVILLHTSK